MRKLQNFLLSLSLIFLFVLPFNASAQERAYEDHTWDVNIGLGVGLYHLIPEPDIELSGSYRFNDFYHLGLQFNCLYIHHWGVELPQKFQYQALVINTFDFYKGRKATWSAKVGLGSMFLVYQKFFVGDLGDIDDARQQDEYLKKIDLHSFSTLVSIVLDYRLTDLFSLGFSMPLTINFNKEHKYWGGFNLLFNMGFHFE